MHTFERLKGHWKHIAQWDSNDYLALYIISGSADAPTVYAQDLSDDEEFIISDVVYQNATLTFTSLMPSTQRRGINKFKLNADGGIEAEFTFTVVEQLKKAAFD